MPTKSFSVQVKATAADDTTLADGQFIALASVFNNVDAVGDVVMPGAFADDLKAWADSGDAISVYWSHQMSDPHMNIGTITEAKETETGLLVRAQLDLDNPTGEQVYKLLKGRRVSKMSFAYDVLDAAPAERDGVPVYELRKLKIHEVSVVQVPANDAAVVQEVKAVPPVAVSYTFNTAGISPTVTPLDVAAVKAGRTLSAKNEATLRSAFDKITGGTTDVKSVLDSLESKDGSGKASPTQPAVPSPDQAKGDEPARPSPASTRLRTDIDALAADVITLED